MPSRMPRTLLRENFSSCVTALATRMVQNGVVALSTEARPAPISVWPAKISENGMTLLRMASTMKLPAIGKARAKDGPRTAR